ncbi:hypothetical protein OQH61_00070 [Helicobacter sp. MIT 21-1697]|uniref:hypothetical protein n=1 Tax=Helicobacter sp. MIT 21-1697 TaxID=2993733 RepID=UPI00224AA6EF|nr:hypothetical protein [Helicobacter sp. MIT 21-1697]MCX2716135.1 hypothetical protein [Helicobacter sp. MIT 21-1697]
MIQPQPYKAICTKCGTSKVVSPKSDALSPQDMPICQKCGQIMSEKKAPNGLDILRKNIKNLFS